MSDLGLINSVVIEAYCEEVSTEDSGVAQAVLEYTKANSSGAHMVSGPLVARFLQILIKLTKAQTVLDIGTFTGYSALSLAEAIPDDGKVYTCDHDAVILSTAQQFFAQSAVGQKIEVIVDDALVFLEKTPVIFDVIFIDADKKRLKDYYEAALKKVKAGGALIIDDMLWRGEVMAPSSERAKAIASLNQYIAQDARVINVLLPIRHGLQLIIVR
jgi:caffeoyl-CoA O-methyltransferase